MMLKVTYPAGAESERLYIFDVMFREFLGLDYLASAGLGDCTIVEMLGTSPGRSVIISDQLLGSVSENWLEERSIPGSPARAMLIGPALAPNALPESLPAFFGEAENSEFAVTASKDAIHIYLEIFGLAFYMLSRYEEAVLSVRDEHGRFPSQQAMVVKENYHHRAIVNEYVELLWAALVTQWPSLTRKPLKYSLDISHDVDEPFCTLRQPLLSVARSAMGDIVKRRSISLSMARCSSYVTSFAGDFEHDPANSFDFIMGLSERLGAQSTFNFLSGRTNVKYDSKYELTDAPVEQLLARISERGHQIGYHGSYDSGTHPDVIMSEASRLRDTCRNMDIHQTDFGGRQHYLRWWNPVTWRAWEAAGLTFDSSLGFSDRVGFRCGTCYEYPVYDVRERRALRLRERPLIAMDIGALREAGWDHEVAFDLLITMWRECRKYNGCFTLLWHNNRLMARADKEFYASLVGALGNL